MSEVLSAVDHVFHGFSSFTFLFLAFATNPMKKNAVFETFPRHALRDVGWSALLLGLAGIAWRFDVPRGEASFHLTAAITFAYFGGLSERDTWKALRDAAPSAALAMLTLAALVLGLAEALA